MTPGDPSATKAKVRFAPSPTGFLHIGGARTALYNWLWARRTGGSFVLRVEDTDAARNTPESRAAIFDSLRWLGLDWDEGPFVGGPAGPYFQSERSPIYREYAEKIIALGFAYRCYATKEEIAEARAKHEASGTKDGFRFDSPWRDRTDKPAGDVPHVIRFKTPKDGSTTWDDLIKGPIEIQHSTLQDFVLMRQNGEALYNFACVVDDMLMGINLVARGADDHMINTTPQILLYKAFGAPVPRFAHLPLILGADGSKLSKRHAAVSVLEYRDMGYLPDAVINYLSRIGWSHGDQEIFSREELIQFFGWDHVGSTAAKYDMKKFEFVQAEHLRRRTNEDLAKLAAPFLEKRGLAVKGDDPAAQATLAAAIEQVKPRATSLQDVAAGVDYFFREPPEQDAAAAKKFLTAETAPRLREFRAVVEAAAPFDVPSLEAATKAWLERTGLTMKDFAQPARVALTGRTASPGLYEVMTVLGRGRSLARLEAGAAQAERAAG